MLIKTIAKIRKHTRAKRYKLFSEFIADMAKPLNIVDIGGTAAHWIGKLSQSDNINITLINNHHIDKTNINYDNRYDFIQEKIMDANDLSISDLSSYDLIFSNSFLEHLENKELQISLAQKITKSGKPYFIQVPNKYCAIDPHFPYPLPFFAAYPKSLQAWLLSKYHFGGGGKNASREQVDQRLKYYNPIGYKDFITMFPNGKLVRERTFGLNLSLVAMSLAKI